MKTHDEPITLQIGLKPEDVVKIYEYEQNEVFAWHLAPYDFFVLTHKATGLKITDCRLITHVRKLAKALIEQDVDWSLDADEIRQCVGFSEAMSLAHYWRAK